MADLDPNCLQIFEGEEFKKFRAKRELRVHKGKLVTTNLLIILVLIADDADRHCGGLVGGHNDYDFRGVCLFVVVLVIATDCDGNISQGLGIMIIEGSHKATGTGIFVSDIQERSAAFHVSLSLSLSLYLYVFVFDFENC